MKLPVTSGKSIVKFLLKYDFIIVGRKGSHIRLKKRSGDQTYIVIVPDHSEISKGTLISIIRQSGINREEFVKGLKKI